MDETIASAVAELVGRNLTRENRPEVAKRVPEGLVVNGRVEILDENVVGAVTALGRVYTNVR